MLRASERQCKKSHASIVELEKLTDTMSVNLKKAQDQYKACKAAELEARTALERVNGSEERVKAELATIQHELEGAREEAGRLRIEIESLETARRSFPGCVNG